MTCLDIRVKGFILFSLNLHILEFKENVIWMTNIGTTEIAVFMTSSDG